MIVIDKTKKEFDDVPATLEGEVLLERPKDGDGKVTGYMTALVAEVRKHKGKTPAELAATGWDRYKPIVDSIA